MTIQNERVRAEVERWLTDTPVDNRLSGPVFDLAARIEQVLTEDMEKREREAFDAVGWPSRFQHPGESDTLDAFKVGWNDCVTYTEQAIDAYLATRKGEQG